MQWSHFLNCMNELHDALNVRGYAEKKRTLDEVTLELIKEFRNHPELWKVRSSAYFRYDFPQRLWWYPNREFQILELSACCQEPERCRQSSVVSRSLGDIAGRITVSCLTMYGVTAVSNSLKAVSSIRRQFLKSSGLFSCNSRKSLISEYRSLFCSHDLHQNLLRFRILFDSSSTAKASKTTAAVRFCAVAMLRGFVKYACAVNDSFHAWNVCGWRTIHAMQWSNFLNGMNELHAAWNARGWPA